MLKSNGSTRYIHRAIPRRTLLRGMGVSLALPLLNAMVPVTARAQAPGVPRRMFGICNNLGLLPAEFFPADAGRDYTPSPYLKILQEYRKDFTVFSGVSHPYVDGGHPSDISFRTHRQPNALPLAHTGGQYRRPLTFLDRQRRRHSAGTKRRHIFRQMFVQGSPLRKSKQRSPNSIPAGPFSTP